MPPSRNTIKSIPTFTPQEIKTADLCARALWYGFNFDSGKKQTSDAELMSFLAKYFYSYKRTRTKPIPDIFIPQVKDLIKTCKVHRMSLSLPKMDIQKGIDAMYLNVYPIFKKSLRNPDRMSSSQEAKECLWQMSKGFIINPNHNCLGLSSRILFFLTPNLRIFNMNRGVAKEYGLRQMPTVHYGDFIDLFTKGQDINYKELSKYKMPPFRSSLDMYTWQKASRTDWWERRVLDIAVLLKLNGKIPFPNLQYLIDKQIEDDAKS